MGRIAAFLYGVIAYGIFFVTFLYAIGFVGNLVVPKSIDGVPTGAFGESLLVDAVLLGLFAIQHSVMARPGFKRWWTRLVPAPVERSTYVLIASLLLLLLFWQWRPLGGIVWDVQGAAARAVLTALFWGGWALVLVGTFLIDHFDLFGLRQVTLFLRGRPYTPVGFRTPGPYKLVRHPIMLGFIIAFWAAPTMTISHLVFAVATTAYILVALQLEERDLMTFHGEAYRRYRETTSMLLPFPSGKRPPATAGPRP